MIRPSYIGLDDWWSSLSIDYPKEIIPRLENEEKWVEAAVLLAGTGIFARANVPSPFMEDRQVFRDWTSWADAVYFTMLNWRE